MPVTSDGGSGTAAAIAAIAAIDAAALEARQRGHNLAGFRRLCRSAAGYRFCARCRGCGQEVSVHREDGGWSRSPVLHCPRRNAPPGSGTHQGQAPGE
ncbi:MAG: hypothetical protein JWM18_2451 [Chloroflexi bacterium]|jgi:hypothetical protein|nr:hypothetical protein [Chloroflexota bacterium]